VEDQTYSLKLGKETLKIQLNNFAALANGSVLVEYGQTVVLISAVMSNYEVDLGYFPLMVDFEEKYYAAGKIRGPRYIKREGKPSDEAILTARMIDRSIRPLFPEELKKEVQVIATCLSWDAKNEPDILGINGASLALCCSNIPWNGPVAAVRVGLVNKNLIINPSYEERENAQLDLVIAAVEKKGEILINMLEGKAEELEEKEFLRVYEFAMPYLKQLLDFQKEIIQKQRIPKEELKKEELSPELKKSFNNKYLRLIEKALYWQGDPATKRQKLEELKESILNAYSEEEEKKKASNLLKYYLNKILHQKILETGFRPDGRKPEEIRPISCKVGLLPRTHGSGLFQRGLTKSLSILTLGAPGDQQLLEGMEIVGKKRFLHHYNFPPFSAGEVKPLRAPSRREIGHGMLAERALMPVIPTFDEFPYTIRVVSEILSSNGSTSMASVCSSSLALMDGGVPIKKPVAGIAMGLISEDEKRFKILTDIQGPEDHHGDMDFKIAGTDKGITAVQMDVKILGITKEIFEKTLFQAKKARGFILQEMKKVIEKPRASLSPYAPRIYTIKINPEKIREVIGPRGKVINEIIEECGVTIDIQPDGLTFITSEKEEGAKKAMTWIKNITREVKPGEVFQGKVKKIFPFGALVEILPGQEGLIHISEIAPYRIKKVEDLLKVGDLIPVKVIEIDTQGRINLSSKDFFAKKKKCQMKNRKKLKKEN